MERDVVAEMEPRMLVLFGTLETDELRRRYHLNAEIADDPRSEQVGATWLAIARTQVRLIDDELVRRMTKAA